MSNRFRVSGFLAQQLTEQKLALPALLQRAGLPTLFFQQEKIYATTAEFFTLWRTIGEMSGDPGIGLKLGAETRLERYHPAAIAGICSQSFRDALQRVAKYKRITCPEEIRVQMGEEEASVEFVFTQAQEVEPEVLVDLCLAWILTIGRRGTDGQLKPLRLELQRREAHREALEAHFGCRAKFKAARNALVFRSSDVDRPFVTHNADLLEAVGAQLEAEFAELNADAGVGEQVRHALKRSLAGKRPTLAHVAQRMGLSARTLQRRLTEAGITFQRVVEETRRELAHHYLEQSTIELTEAAYLLGYENANSFFRAFHLWEGTTPGEWRATRRAGVSQR